MVMVEWWNGGMMEWKDRRISYRMACDAPNDVAWSQRRRSESGRTNGRLRVNVKHHAGKADGRPSADPETTPEGARPGV